MCRAVEALAEQLPDFQAATVLVDGIYPIAGLKAKQVAVPNGDENPAAIAAASVVAKVARDDLMLQLDREFGSLVGAQTKATQPRNIAMPSAHTDRRPGTGAPSMCESIG